MMITLQPTEAEMLAELRQMTLNKNKWESTIGRAGELLRCDCVSVQAKALWLLGETGLLHPNEIRPYVEVIAGFLDCGDALLRERALNALGRIGRGDCALVRPHLGKMRLLATDTIPAVRLAFIWACENIAANAPQQFESDMPLFASLLEDENDRVRIEAPEIFRVLGKRKPEYVTPYLSKLQEMSENDAHRVVRIHAAGAIKAASKGAPARETDK